MRLGTLGAVADLLDRAGDPGLAAVLRAQDRLAVGDRRAAAQGCLRRVAEESDDWRQARILLGDVHEQLGRAGEAAVCYAQGIEEAHIDARNVATYYLAGACALTADKMELASEHLEVVHADDPLCRDVADLWSQATRIGLPSGAAPVDVAMSYFKGDEVVHAASRCVLGGVFQTVRRSRSGGQRCGLSRPGQAAGPTGGGEGVGPRDLRRRRGPRALAHISQAAASPSSFRSDLPPWVDTVVERCLRKDPDARYLSTDSMLAELETIAA